MPASSTVRDPIPQYDHYAELRYPALLGAETHTIGPFRTVRECRKAIAAAQAPYPGSYAPSARPYAVER